MPVDIALRIGLDIVEGLQQVRSYSKSGVQAESGPRVVRTQLHQREILMLDLKPLNVLMDDRGIAVRA